MWSGVGIGQSNRVVSLQSRHRPDIAKMTGSVHLYPIEFAGSRTGGSAGFLVGRRALCADAFSDPPLRSAAKQPAE